MQNAEVLGTTLICVHQCSSLVQHFVPALPCWVHSPRCRAVAAGLWLLPICFGFRASDFGFPPPPGCAFASWRLCVNGRLLD